MIDPQGTELGRVGRDGIAWIRAPIGTQRIEVRWSKDGETLSCRIALDEEDTGTLLDATCKDSPQ